MILPNVIWILSGLQLNLALKLKTEPNSALKKNSTWLKSAQSSIFFRWFCLRTGETDFHFLLSLTLGQMTRGDSVRCHDTPVAFQILLSDRFLSILGGKKSISLITKHFFHKEIPRVSSLQKQKHNFLQDLSTGTEEERVKCAGEILAGIIKCLS